jgi:predicted nucleic acid-binding protein
VPTATVKVVDASAVAALIFDESRARDMLLRFTGARLIAPALIDLELANVRVTRQRRGQVRLAAAAP